jgi:ATP-dependent helicase/nuclease subunit A
MSNVLQFPQGTPPETKSAPAQTSDAEARELALDIRTSCIVEAPAGSGKTGLLVQRLLKLLAEADIHQPEEVLAVTFTKKATAELLERVLHHLHAAHTQPQLSADASDFDRATHSFATAVLERSRRLDWHLLERPQRLNIRSIDSICAEIANALPLLSGSGPRQPMQDARPLYRLAARRTLLELGGPNEALHQALRSVLLHRDANLADCENLLADMLAAREQWGELIPLGPGEIEDSVLDNEVRPRLERSLEAIVCTGLSHALNTMPSHLLHDLTSFAVRHAHLPGYKDFASPIAPCAMKNDPPEAVADHLDHWLTLLGLLFTKGDEWRSSFNINQVGFAMGKGEKAELAQILDAFKSHADADRMREALCAIRTLPPTRYPDEQWVVAKALFRVLRHALAELRLLFSERGECDFTEFALNAREALRSEHAAGEQQAHAAGEQQAHAAGEQLAHAAGEQQAHAAGEQQVRALAGDPAYAGSTDDASATDLALSSGGRLRHLLVDEMQDTSSGQYDLLYLLTRSWDGASQTLFLVGDPKQSIYLFRQARVERFLRTMHDQRLGEINLRPLRLTANFRSQANLVAGFNSAFELLFPSPQTAGPTDVPFVAAQATRDAADSKGIEWHATLLTDENTSTYAADEARTIRHIIEQRLATPLPEGRTKPWRVAVLARARTHLAEIVAEFKRDRGHGPLAYRAVDIDPLSELPEVLDALALTRALLHPGDRVAWLAVLRAPWCGLSMADLLALTGEGPDADATATVAHLVATRSNLLSKEGQQLLARSWPILRTAAATVGQTPLSTHVERTWRSLGADVSSSRNARNSVAQYIHLLREGGLKDSQIELTTLAQRLKNLYAEPQSGDDIQVELLTMHKAKGLEWDLVLVPGLQRRPSASRPNFLNWLEVESNEQDASIILAPIWGKGDASDNLNNWLKSVRGSRERAEEKRLFYVASTRAREELHLFAAAVTKDGQTPQKPTQNTLLAACWNAAAPHFAAPSTLHQDLELSLSDHEEVPSNLSFAASAETSVSPSQWPILQRLPTTFDPSERFQAAQALRLPYSPAVSPTLGPDFERPEGSFAVRAFGNVVHRYLQLMAERLAAEGRPDALQRLTEEVPKWEARLLASLRGEALPPNLAAREAKRALQALISTLSDPVGQWILVPHAEASSEQGLVTSQSSLRVDRTFVAGNAPLNEGTGTIWIVDFKTTTQGSRTDEEFREAEFGKYRTQLEAYAALRRSLPGGDRPIALGLYYPLVTKLLQWT